MVVCDVSDSFDCLPQFKVLARESRDKNEKYRYKMEVKNGQIVGEDGEVEKLAMVQTKICLLSKVYSFEACFKLKAQKQRKQSWAYEPRQGLGDLWRVYRHTSDVENDSLLPSNCSGH